MAAAARTVRSKPGAQKSPQSVAGAQVFGLPRAASEAAHQQEADASWTRCAVCEVKAWL